MKPSCMDYIQWTDYFLFSLSNKNSQKLSAFAKRFQGRNQTNSETRSRETKPFVLAETWMGNVAPDNF